MAPQNRGALLTRRTLAWVVGVSVPLVSFAVVGASGSGDEGSGAAPSSIDIGAAESTTSSGEPTTTSMPAATTTTTVAPAGTTTVASTTSVVGPIPIPPGWEVATVLSVTDGDTIEVRLEYGTVERLRLIGTNSPEDGECFSTEATVGLADLILGETVYLESDVSDRDQFDRLLRYVWTTDQRHVNEITVAEGWAIAREYPPDTARTTELAAAQGRAADAEAGLWAPDACGVAVAADVEIVRIEYDAPGNDNNNLNGEWVEIRNNEATAVDLTGWVLKDESASHRYQFPRAFTLQGGATVLVYTGCGQDTATALYWCKQGSAVWNNDGDTGFLLDPSGNVVWSYAYG